MLDRNNVATRTARTLGTIKPVIGETEIKTRSGESMKITDTTMYIFNFADDHGYALISTNSLTQNIIAIVENGSLNSVSNVCNGEMPQLYYAILAHESEKQFMLKNLDSLTNSAYTKLDKLNLDSEPSSRTIITDVVHNNEYGAGSITITDNGYRKTYLPWTIHQKNYFVKSVWGIQGDFTKNCPKASCGHKCSVGSHTPAIAQLAYYNRIFNRILIWSDDMVYYQGQNVVTVDKNSQRIIQELYKYIVVNTISTQNMRCMEPGCPNFGVSITSMDQVTTFMTAMGFPLVLQRQMNDANLRSLVNTIRTSPVLMTAINTNAFKNYFWIADGHVDLIRTVIVTDIVSGASISIEDGPYKSELMHYNVGCDGYYNGYYKTYGLDFKASIELDFSNKPEFDPEYPEETDYLKYPNGTENYQSEFNYFLLN